MQHLKQVWSFTSNLGFGQLAAVWPVPLQLAQPCSQPCIHLVCGHVRLLESDLLRSPLLRLVSRMCKSTGANSAGQRPYALHFVCLLIHLCSYWVSHQAMNGLGKGCPNGHATRRSSVMAIDECEQHLRAMCTNHSTSASQCRSSVARKIT